MSELTTKWPHLGLYGGSRLDDGSHWFSVPSQEAAYERARAEAALERLRLAVEALRKIENLIGQLSPDHFVDQDIGERHAAKSHDIAWAAIRDIGPLPDLPPVQKEGG